MNQVYFIYSHIYKCNFTISNILRNIDTKIQNSYIYLFWNCLTFHFILLNIIFFTDRFRLEIKIIIAKIK